MKQRRILQKEVLKAAKKLHQEGMVVGTAGNVSGRLENGSIWITPSSIEYESMQENDLVLLGSNGEQLEGKHSKSTESQIHLECYKAFAEIGGVVHSHPPYASMFAVAKEPIPAAIEEVVVYLGGDIRVAEYQKTGSQALAETLSREVADRSAVLMANHGLLTIGKNPPEALKAALVAERTAEIVWGAKFINSSTSFLELGQDVLEEFSSIYTFVRSEMWS